MDTPLHDVDAFLAQAPWLRRLAVQLADASDADDLVQETWVKLAASPPEHAQAPRGWLATVLRNARKMQLRGRERRVHREAASSDPEPLPDAETLVARAQQFRTLTEAVEALAEPLRRTILLHFFEGISLAEIARREGCPSATVRARLRTGLTRLRTALDGDRSAWLPAFAALRPATLAMKTTTKLALAFGAIAAAVTVTAAASGPAGPDEDTTEAQAIAAAGSAPRTRSTATELAPTRDAEPTAESEHAAPPLPRPEINLPRFADEAARASKREAIEKARLARLADAGMPADLVQEAGDDTKLLGDIEQMMMSEDAGKIGLACLEASPPTEPGVTTFTVAFEGEPDVGTVITDVTRHGEEDEDAFATCVRESLYLLSIPPPAEGGLQTLEVFFDTDADPLITGVQQPEQ